MPASRALEDGNEIPVAHQRRSGEGTLCAGLRGQGGFAMAIVVAVTLPLGLRGALPGLRTPLY